MIMERPLTNGSIALLNLGDQIDTLEHEIKLGDATASAQAGLVELIMLRGLILGHIADYFRAEAIAEQLVRDAPADANAPLARARTRAMFHRFNEALDDVDRAEHLPRCRDGERRTGGDFPGARPLR
jgi:hypothetical protein